MTSHHTRKHARSSVTGPRSLESLPADQLSDIYRDIQDCYKESRASQQTYGLASVNNWVYYGTVVGAIVIFWGCAISLVRWFPHTPNIVIIALILYVLGLAPYLYFTVSALIQVAKRLSRSIKRGALDEFTRACTKSEIEGGFVNQLIKYDEHVLRFILTELEMARSELEAWPKHVLSSFGAVGLIFTIVGAPGFFVKLLAPETIKTTTPLVSSIEVTAMGALFLFFLVTINDSFERPQAVRRVIALIHFSLGDIEGNDGAESGEAEIKIEVKDDAPGESAKHNDGAVANSPPSSVD